MGHPPPTTHRRRLLCLLLAACLVPAAGCKDDKESGEISMAVFTAGSLSIPFRDVSRRFMELHPGTRVLAEAAGSRDTARKVSDLGRRCDVLGSADHQVVENLLMPAHAAFNIVFATNEMALAYTKKSRQQDRITAANWHEVLLDPKVSFGRSDPDRDPCGYRTVMLFQLAERHYKVAGLARRLEQKDGRRHIRPKETDLVALLEVGQIDYIFTYRSLAIQHGLKFLTLPAQINLSAPSMAARYRAARVKVTGKKPGQTITRVGAPIAYSVTIPKKAPNRRLAEGYLDLLLSAEGQAIIKRNGQGPVIPPRATGEVPARLRRHLAGGTRAP